MEQKNNNMYNEINVDIKYINVILNRGIIIETDNIVTIINLVSVLYTRYYFKYPIILYNAESNTYTKIPTIYQIDFQNKNKYIICVDLHKQILIIPIKEFEKYNKSIKYKISTCEKDFKFIFKKIDDSILNVSVNYILSYDNDCKISIFHNKIYFNINQFKYEITRDVLDMLYAESQDFIFTKNKSKILLRSEVRHSIYYESLHICDILKDDLAIILDTQDRLKREYETIQTSYNYMFVNKSDDDLKCKNNDDFKFNFDEFL